MNDFERVGEILKREGLTKVSELARTLSRLMETEDALAQLNTGTEPSIETLKIAGLSEPEARTYKLLIRAAKTIQADGSFEKLSVQEITRDLQAAQTKILARATLRRLGETAPEAGGS